MKPTIQKTHKLKRRKFEQSGVGILSVGKGCELRKCVDGVWNTILTNPSPYILDEVRKHNLVPLGLWMRANGHPLPKFVRYYTSEKGVSRVTLYVRWNYEVYKNER